MFPTAEMSPVTTRFPVIFVVDSMLTVPVPLGCSSIEAFELNVEITFPVISISSTCNLEW